MVKEAKKKCYGKWNIPAGHLEEGETIHEGAIREIFEETGCKVELIGMLPIINRKIENATDTLKQDSVIKENLIAVNYFLGGEK